MFMNEMMRKYEEQRGLEGKCRDKLPSTVILATIPVTIEYHANGEVRMQHEPTADEILARYQPTLFPAIISASGLTPHEMESEIKRPVANTDELVYSIFAKNTRKLVPGNGYFWSLPVLQEKDCFGQYVGKPFICTRGQPTATPLYK
jgi:hypothetical protein